MFQNCADYFSLALASRGEDSIVTTMQDALSIPNDLAGCQALIQQQAQANAQLRETIAGQERKIAELGVEMEKVRKLLSQFVNGHRSEKRLQSGPDHQWLPFES